MHPLIAQFKALGSRLDRAAVKYAQNPPSRRAAPHHNKTFAVVHGAAAFE